VLASTASVMCVWCSGPHVFKTHFRPTLGGMLCKMQLENLSWKGTLADELVTSLVRVNSHHGMVAILSCMSPSWLSTCHKVSPACPSCSKGSARNLQIASCKGSNCSACCCLLLRSTDTDMGGVLRRPQAIIILPGGGGGVVAAFRYAHTVKVGLGMHNLCTSRHCATRRPTCTAVTASACIHSCREHASTLYATIALHMYLRQP
jgi:hypothetical protein